jgi:hypothetical protein
MSVLALLTLLIGQVEDLDSKDPATARRAFERAIQKGDEAPLEKAAATSIRAKRALAEIRAHKRFGEYYPPLPVTTLDVQDQPPGDVIKALSKSMGIPIVDYDRFGPTQLTGSMSLKLADAGPLEAFDAFCAAATLGGRIDGRRFLYMTNHGGHRQGLWYWRHFAFDLREYREVRKIDPLAPVTESASIEVFVRHGPLGRVGVHLGPAGVEVVDEKGDELAGGFDQRMRPALFSDWASHSTFQVNFKKPAEGRSTLAKVRGSMPVVIPEKKGWKEVPLDGSRKNVEWERLAVRVEAFDPAGRTAILLTWIPDYGKPYVLAQPEDVEIVGKDGTRVAAKGTRSWSASGFVLDLEFAVPAGFSPASLRIAYFETLGEHLIPFEFNDVKVR